MKNEKKLLKKDIKSIDIKRGAESTTDNTSLKNQEEKTPPKITEEINPKIRRKRKLRKRKRRKKIRKKRRKKKRQRKKVSYKLKNLRLLAQMDLKQQ